MMDNEEHSTSDEECVIHDHPVPPEELHRYSPGRDPHRERDIAEYVEGQAKGEIVQHVELVKTEVVLGQSFEIWDVTTDQDRWWVITNLTNLYSQRHFPSLDYTLSFHIGLMARLRSRSRGARSEEPSPYDDILRRYEQASARHEHALEVEDYQAVGMQLRECLISLVAALRRRVDISDATNYPQDANFVAWAELLIDLLCEGSSNKKLRRYLRNAAGGTWRLVNWLTHDRNANEAASYTSLQACEMLMWSLMMLHTLNRIDATGHCPQCNSRQIRSHFDWSIAPDGDYYQTCSVCGWSSHPGNP